MHSIRSQSINVTEVIFIVLLGGKTPQTHFEKTSSRHWYLRQGDCVFDTIGLPICLFVSNITQKVMNKCNEILRRGPGW